MRHNKKFNHLSRSASHRRALLANMSISLIRHKRINTTVAKAKALRKYVEPLLTRCKNDTTHSRRIVFSYLHDKAIVTELFNEVSLKIGDRPGGYTRIIKTYSRKGDGADMCFIELVDYDENMAKTEKVVKKTRRSRRAKSSSQTSAQPQEQTTVQQEQEVEPKEEKQEEAIAQEEAPAQEETSVQEETPAQEEEEK